MSCLARIWQLTSHGLPGAWSTGLHINSLALERSECNSKNGIFNLVLLIGIFRSYDNAFRWMPQDLTDDKSTLVQVMAWCRQATSHYLSQCWLSPLSPYGIARPQWVEVWLGHVSIIIGHAHFHGYVPKWASGFVNVYFPYNRSSNYTPCFNEVERGVYWYHLVRLSVCPSVDRIVSALYLQQYSSDPFHICTSYQATSEGVSREILTNFLNL